MSKIVVVTKDGRHPRDGGIRVGYAAEGYFMPLGSTALIPLAPPKPKTPLLDAYQELPLASDWSCGHCGSSWGIREGFIMTEEGPKPTISCRNCGNNSRPHRR